MAGVSPVLAQMWAGVSPVPVQMWQAVGTPRRRAAPRDEARVEEVQDGVLDAADVVPGSAEGFPRWPPAAPRQSGAEGTVVRSARCRAGRRVA